MARKTLTRQPLRVRVALGPRLERLAYASLLRDAGVLVAADDAEAQVRLADRCDADSVPTVVLGEGGCRCCTAFSRGGSVEGLVAALASAVGEEVAPAASVPDIVDSLTRRERDVLRLVGRGLSAPQCAAALGLSPSTVGNHKHRLMRKLGVSSSLQLLRIAVRHGLAELD